VTQIDRAQLAVVVLDELARVTESPRASLDESTELDAIGLDSMGTIEVLVGVYDVLGDGEDLDDSAIDELPQTRTAGELIDFIVLLAT
jgi:acyl carrier protein